MTARRAVVSARDEAILHGHDYIGTEHLLLGLTSISEGEFALTLERLGISGSDIRSVVQRLIREGAQRPIGEVPFTQRSRRVFDLARIEAELAEAMLIGPEHILLGLIREGHGTAAEALGKLSLSLDVVRRAVMGRSLAAPNQVSAIDEWANGVHSEPVPSVADRVRDLDEWASRRSLPTVVVVVLHEVHGSAELRLDALRAILPSQLGETRMQVVDVLAGMQTVYPLNSGFDLQNLHLASTAGPSSHEDAKEAIVEGLTSLHLQLDVDGSVPNFYLVVLIADRSLDSSSKPTELTRLGTDVVYLRAGNFGTQLQPSELSAEREGSLTLLDLRYSSAETVAEVVASAVGQGIVRVWREMRIGGG